LAGSPVIDSGTAVPAGTTDLDGHPRPDVAGSRPDQGAYESSLTRQPPVCDAGAASSTLGQPVRITFGCTSSPPLTSSYAVASEPAHGTLSDLDAANGAVTYTPAAGFTGTDTFTYGATNDAGSVTTTVTVTVKPVVPVLTAVHQTHRRWRRGLLQATIARRSRKAPLGTRFTFGLNESAGVTLTFTAIQKHRAGKKHKRVRPAGTLSFTGHPGDNTVAFYGPISPTHTLARGRYTVAIVASTTAGSARPVILRFTVVR
jgi:hypothetical protein